MEYFWIFMTTMRLCRHRMAYLPSSVMILIITISNYSDDAYELINDTDNIGPFPVTELPQCNKRNVFTWICETSQRILLNHFCHGPISKYRENSYGCDRHYAVWTGSRSWVPLYHSLHILKHAQFWMITQAWRCMTDLWYFPEQMQKTSSCNKQFHIYSLKLNTILRHCKNNSD